MGNELDETKTKYFVIAIILLILIGIILVIHFNNKSLVGPENIEKTPTTTTQTTTIQTNEVKEEKSNNNNSSNNNYIKQVSNTKNNEEQIEETIYKSIVDENNNIIFNYKLTNEIKDNYKIITKLLNIDSENLLSNNIISLYDISLYDENMSIKTVSNSLITISIPLTNNLIGYDEYKIVYIDENNNITNEEFKTEVKDGYIKFETTHLSKYGIIATKKQEIIEETNEEQIIDLTNVSIDLKLNNELIDDYTNIYASTNDILNVDIKGLESDYKLYYLLKNDSDNSEYLEFKEDLLSNIETPNKYTLFIKVVVDSNVKVFEVGTINIYDIVFKYAKDEKLEEDLTIGKITDEYGNESSYIDKNTNKNIVIKPIEEEVDNIEETLDNNETDTNINESDSEELEEKATINLNGNIYLVEKTDISDLEMKGHLIIDTKDDITFDVYNDKLLVSDIYTITIKSKEFSLNGIKYTYEYVDNNLIIRKLEDNSEITKENFEELFNGYGVNTEEPELTLENFIN